MDALKDFLSGLSTADVGAIGAIIVLVLFGGVRRRRGERRVSVPSAGSARFADTV